MKPFLLPTPKKLTQRRETSLLELPLRVCWENPAGLAVSVLETICPGVYVGCAEEADVLFHYDQSIASQGYSIEITRQEIHIAFSDSAGAFYALVTLWQIFQTHGKPPCCRLEDEPSITDRGFMLDVSRGKVPKLKTLKRLVDLLARFKYNQLQLYTEGFSFTYPSFPEVTDEEHALTPAEIEILDDYCARRFIELVPNQNSLGHMAQWLALPGYRRLAECENGLRVGDYTLPPTTLNAEDSGSLELVAALIDDLLCHFSSARMHAGLDEPFELGKGKNTGKDPEKLFLNYADKLNAMVKKHGKQMMIWADCVSKSDFLLQNLPEDITLMEWGYEKEYPFEKRCHAIQAAGKHFYTCPGTGSWLSFTGMTDNMLANVKSAVNAALDYGGDGVLLTDWGDMHHLQYLPVSYPAIVFCAGLAWSGIRDLPERELAHALNVFVFQDGSGNMGQLALEAGRYYQKEEFYLPCRTLASVLLNGASSTLEQYNAQIDLLFKIISILSPDEVSKPYLTGYQRMQPDEKGVLDMVDRLLGQLKQITLGCSDGNLIIEEYSNALRMVRLLSEYRFSVLNSTPFRPGRAFEIMIDRHKELWLRRNKVSGLQSGIDCLERLKERG